MRREFHDDHAFALPRLAEAHGHGRAAVADGLGAVHGLCHVEVPQREVVEAGGESFGRHAGERADIQFANPVVVDRPPAHGEQMPHAHDRRDGRRRRGRPQCVLFIDGDRARLAVVFRDSLDQFPALVLGCFAGFDRAHVPVPQERHGADDQLRSSVRGPQHQHLVRGVGGGAADDVDVEDLEQFARRVQEGRRIVVAADDDDMAAGRGGQPAQEAVVQLLGRVAGRDGVEDVAGDEQRVDLPLPDRLLQPVQERLRLVMAFSAVEVPSDVPVGRVKEFRHDAALSGFCRGSRTNHDLRCMRVEQDVTRVTRLTFLTS